MALGTRLLREAVVTLTQHVDDLGNSLRDGINDTRTLVLDAVGSARGDLAGRIDDTRGDLGRRIDDSRHGIDALTRDLGAARREIAELHTLLQTWRAEAAEARTPAPRNPEPATTPTPAAAAPAAGKTDDGDPERARSRHLDLMLAAAGISQADFTCHRDLWAHLVRKAGNEPHFHIPGDVEERHGNIQATLSGPTLVAALTAMWQARDESRRNDPATGDWALANELYEAVAAAVEKVRTTPRPHNPHGVVITIDRRPVADAAR